MCVAREKKCEEMLCSGRDEVRSAAGEAVMRFAMERR